HSERSCSNWGGNLRYSWAPRKHQHKTSYQTPIRCSLSPIFCQITEGVQVFKEFKEFAMKGNVLDLAIGVIIGVAFGKIISSLVDDVINPIIGLVLGKVDFNNFFVNLSGQSYTSVDAAKKAGAPVLAYGSFLNTIINFLIVAFVLFLIVR